MTMPRRCLLALISGVCLPFAFAPYGLWPLAVLSPAALLFLLQSISPRRALLLGWCYGIGMFGYGVWWIQVSVHQFGLPYYVFSVGVTALFIAGMALYPALFAGTLSRFVAARAPLVLAAPALWVSFEYLRGWLFSGFPWLALGYSQIDGPLAGFAPIIGVYGCSGLVMVQAALLFRLTNSNWRARAMLLMAIGAIGATGVAVAKLEFTQVSEHGLTVALIQGAVPQALKWQRELRTASIDLYTELSAPHWDADLIVWPETAIPAFPHEVEQRTASLALAARENDVDLLIGMPTGEPWNGSYYNSLVDFGLTPGRYDKHHLVPFGEFYPFKDMLSGLAMLLHIPLSDFSAGSPDKTTLDVAGHLAGISICYEDAFGREINRALPAAAFLVNISNDAWFGDTIAPHQHLEIARMRALETSRYLLRATNTGITAIIDDRGRVVERGAQFVKATVRGTFAARTGATPYVRHGDLTVLVFAAAALAVSVVLAWRSRRGAAAQ